MSERRAQNLAILITVVLVGGFFIVRWFRENPVQGWLIIVAVVGILGFSVYRFPAFRSSLFRTAKKSADSLVHETKVAQREPLDPGLRQHILEVAGYRCQNPDCRVDAPLKIHHIDGNRNNNNPRNLIALCGTCHDRAHSNQYPNSQLRVWVQRSRGERRWGSSRRRSPRYRH